MRFGVISGNGAINERIYAAFEHLHPDDVPKVAAKFKSTTDTHRFHIFRELLVGAHLRANGLDVRYERSVEGKTPDWTLVDERGDPLELIDVATIHPQQTLEIEIRRALSAGAIWSGWPGTHSERIFRKVDDKAGAYAELAANLGVAYSVFLHGEFTAFLDAEDIEEVLLGEAGVFAARYHLSGVGFFTHANGVDTYTYFSNPQANQSSVVIPTLIERGAYAA